MAIRNFAYGSSLPRDRNLLIEVEVTDYIFGDQYRATNSTAVHGEAPWQLQCDKTQLYYTRGLPKCVKVYIM